MYLENRILEIEESPQLFQDYLYHFEKLSAFFQWDPRNDWERCLQVRASAVEHRKTVGEVLRAQNRAWEAPPTVLDNIEKLTQPKSVAIVTGQQAGLFGGPLYTVYKIITVIKLARHLNRQYPAWNFIPGFWMEVTDNDYGEINHIHLLTIGGELHTLHLPDAPRDYRSIYRREIPREMDSLFTSIMEITPETEFREPVFSLMKTIYQPGRSFAVAFARWLLNNFGEYGLVVVNPADRKLAELVRPLYHQALTQCHVIASRVEETSRQLLEQGYHNQIQFSPGQTLLFCEGDDQGRYRLDRKSDRWILARPGKPIQMTNTDLLGLLENSPERFTPNVALRPIVQDYLLPTAAYVAGPGEISYAAQLKSLYQFFGVTPPIFYPRIRATIVEKKINRLVQKFGLTYASIFQKRGKIIEDYRKVHTDQNLEKVFFQAENQISSSLKAIAEYLGELDPTLIPPVKKTEDTMKTNLARLKQKAEKAFESRLRTELDQLQKILTHLFPNNIYQERVFNILSYELKYGPDFIKAIYESTIHDSPGHQLLFI
ncbi:MAG: bacillithiol biosynthesis cysteine-adding enzyme BshC [Calditrichia bacterium]